MTTEAYRLILQGYARQLDSMAAKLAAKVPPGHSDYISKARAAEWASALAHEARQLLEETNVNE